MRRVRWPVGMPAPGALALAASSLAGCGPDRPAYPYGPGSYPPSYGAPYQPVPIPLPGSSITATPLPPPPGTTSRPDLPPLAGTPDPRPEPDAPELAAPEMGAPGLSGPGLAPLAPDLFGLPPVADTPPVAEPSPRGPGDAGGDPVTDLLLTPLPQRDAAQPAAPPPTLSKAPSGPDANPLMGFRPMRGQTPRSY